jgi:hypothetical protein
VRCRRRLDAAGQALLVLAHLRNGDTFTRLATGFGVGTSTAWRYVREAVDLLAGLADDLQACVRRAARLTYAILDGTLVPIDRVAEQKPYYSGKHKRHGVNVQVIADPAGRLIWASPALPGAIHDLAAARAHGVVDALTAAGAWRRSRAGRSSPSCAAVPAAPPPSCRPSSFCTPPKPTATHDEKAQ